MGFAYEEPDSSTTDTSSTSSVTTYEDYNTSESSYSLDETATGTSGGYATSDPYSGETYDDTSTTQGGEYTYDIDPSVSEDTALDYTSINDPRQTADDTTGTAGGEVEDTSVETGYVGLINPDQYAREEEVEAIADLTHTDDGSHTTDQLQGDPVEMITAGESSVEDAWNAVTPDVPGDDNGDGIPDGNVLPSLPEFPDPSDQDAIGVGLLLAAGIAIYVGFREVVA